MVFVKRVVHFFSQKLKQYLPDRTKRLFVLASLSSQICNKTTYDREYLRKLNEVMQLGSGDHALMLPMALSKAVWQDKVSGTDVVLFPKQEVPQKCWNQIAKQLTDSVPNCLQYSTYQDMFEDIRKLLENKPTFA